jgi:hypothetical protein
VRCLTKNILALQMKMIEPDCLILPNDVDFLKCLVVSTVCIESGKIIHWLSKGCIVAM